jgi:cytochrome c oxidase subunit 2
VPGHEIEAWFEATQTGNYEIPCAELCGFGHSGMLGHLYVDSPEDYEKWKNETWPPAVEPAASADSLNAQTPPDENQN